MDDQNLSFGDEAEDIVIEQETNENRVNGLNQSELIMLSSRLS